MGLFHLLTLYAFIRSTETATQRRLWPAVAVTACALGMLTKEVMATAPLMVLLYDRTFIAGSFREAWRKRWRLHAALMATWLLLLHAFRDSSQRPIGAGHGVGSWDYALTQCRSILHYLMLAVWPHPLVLDYGSDFVTSPLQVLPQALVLLGLLAATTVALVRRPALGFAGAWFFLILAPTSSFIPVPKAPVGDNRLYLPLAAVVALLVLSLHRWLGKKSWYVYLALAVVWGTLTFLRNEDFASKTALWKQTVEAVPTNAQAFCDYGEALIEAGRNDEAVAMFQRGLELRPDYPEDEVNLGFALMQVQRPQEAIPHFQHALSLKPDFADAHNNWGNALAQMHEYEEAIPHYQEAIRLRPAFAIAHYNCGNMYLKLGRLPEGFAEYAEALRYQPDFPELRYNWGNALMNHGRPAEAIEQYRAALQSRPQWAEVHNNLGMALFDTGDRQDAIEEFQATLRIDPNYTSAADNLASAQTLQPAHAAAQPGGK
jgi:tetratricopeptide (TPR) repeat protein